MKKKEQKKFDSRCLYCGAGYYWKRDNLTSSLSAFCSTACHQDYNAYNRIDLSEHTNYEEKNKN